MPHDSRDHQIRAALRIAAIDLGSHEAMKRINDTGAPAMVAAILRVEARKARQLPDPDAQALVLGAIAAHARADRTDKEWNRRLDGLMRAGASVGVPQRAMGEAAGMSHTAVQYRLRRA